MENNPSREHVGRNFVLLTNESRPGKRLGIYARGGCDLRLILGLSHLIKRQGFDGSYCILQDGTASDARSDLLLQALQGLPLDEIEPVSQQLNLGAAYFQSRLFNKTFAVPGFEDVGEFSKDVVIISVGPDVVRTMYRHREKGFLVDPGGGWLNQNMEMVLKDLSVVSWFRKNFQSIGMIPLEEAMANYTQIIQLLKEKVCRHLLVFNTLSIDPGSLTHNYQFVKDCHVKRRLEFNLALVELSRKLDFSVINLDRILKRAGTGQHVDFGHLPPKFSLLTSQEVFRVMHELGVFEERGMPDRVRRHRSHQHASADHVGPRAVI
jgi:hypothetical protein